MTNTQLIHGDCLKEMPSIPGDSVDAVVTSPPYAMQREKQYGGISELEYPAWCVSWMNCIRPILSPHGNVFINIRENVRNGSMSDYVHKTRLALRENGWNECDELIWIKPHSMPVGHPGRPRRSWERILWFSLTKQPACYPKNNGRKSSKIGIDNRAGGVAASWSAVGTHLKNGIARSRDYVEVTTAANTGNMRHPAMYPVGIAEWMIKLGTQEGMTILDPFMGSGTTGVACANLRRKFIGIELDANYFRIAQERIKNAVPPLFAEVATA